MPSRVHPGEFYALPQSPQLYKQLLMVAGFDRYFQIARCFRDEDLRQDRQPEFTQIDIEASFVGAEDIMRLAEGLIRALWREAGSDVPAHVPADDLRRRDGAVRHRPARPALRPRDLRRERRLPRRRLRHHEDGARARAAACAAFACRAARRCRASRSTRSRPRRRSAGAVGLLRLKCANGALDGPAAKFLARRRRRRSSALAEGDLALLVAGADRISSPALDRVRQDVGAPHEPGAGTASNAFVWVIDFPMFEQDPDTGALGAVHHPFTAPIPRTSRCSTARPERARAQAYDLVFNGTELGGGSIRISDPRLQARIFRLLGIDEATAQARFGFLLEGLRAGAPPHGGIAFGFDRIAMLLAGATSLRDVIAFPKTTAARALFEGAPTPVPPNGPRGPAHPTSRREHGVSDDSVTQKLSTEGADLLTLAGVNDANLVELSRARRGARSRCAATR